MSFIELGNELNFDDRVLVREGAKDLVIDDETKNSIYYHTLNYSSRNLDYIKESAEFIYDYINGKTGFDVLELSCDRENYVHNSVGFAIKGHVLALIDEDMYTLYNDEGQRTLPKQLVPFLVGSLKDLEESDQTEIVVDVKSIEYVWYVRSIVKPEEFDLIKKLADNWNLALVSVS